MKNKEISNEKTYETSKNKLRKYFLKNILKFIIVILLIISIVLYLMFKDIDIVSTVLALAGIIALIDIKINGNRMKF